MPAYWLSCPKCTVLAVLDARGIIQDTAPFTLKFKGQPLERLRAWLMRFGTVDVVKLED